MNNTVDSVSNKNNQIKYGYQISSLSVKSELLVYGYARVGRGRSFSKCSSSALNTIPASIKGLIFLCTTSSTAQADNKIVETFGNIKNMGGKQAGAAFLDRLNCLGCATFIKYSLSTAPDEWPLRLEIKRTAIKNWGKSHLLYLEFNAFKNFRLNEFTQILLLWKVNTEKDPILIMMVGGDSRESIKIKQYPPFFSETVI